MQAKIFISYSRRNKDFTQRLFDALVDRGYDPWVDWDDIPFSVDWWQEIRDAINQHDVVILVVSNESMKSRVVNKEITYAREINKRIIPLIIEKVDMRSVVAAIFDEPYEMDARDNWKYIRTLNWIYFYRDEDDFDSGIDGILTATEVDHDYLREHTRILNRAQEWNENKRGDGFLLRGEELAEAERWLARAEDHQRMPVPTALHREYIQASRTFEDEQAAQLDAMRRQTQLLRGAAILLIVTGVFVTTVIFLVFNQQQRNNRQQIAALAEDRDAVVAEVTQAAATQVAIEARIAAQSTESAQTQQAIRAEGTQAAATQQAVIADIESARQQSDSLRLASEAENALENNDPNLLAIPLALVAHRVVETGSPPPRVGRILADAAYRPGLVRFFVGEDDGTAHRREISDLAFSVDGALAVSASQDQLVRVWDVATGETVLELVGHAGRVTSVAINADGSQIISGDANGEIIVWDAASGEMTGRIDAHSGRVTDLAYAPDGTQFVSTSADTTVGVWDAATGEQIRQLGTHSSRVTRVAYHPQGETFITGDADGLIYVWNPDNSFFLREENFHRQAISGIAYSADGSTVITSSLDGRFILWDDFDNAERRINDTLSGTPLRGIAFLNDDTALIGTEAGDMLIWDLRVPADENGERYRLQMPGRPATLSTLATSPNRRYAVAAYASNEMTLWEVEHGALIERLKFSAFPVVGTAASADGEIVFRYLNGDIVMRAANGTITTTSEAALGVSGVRLLPDGQTALANDAETGELVQIDLPGGERLRTYDHNFAAAGTVFAANGEIALSQSQTPQVSQLAGSLGDTSGAARTLWRVETGEIIGAVDNPLLNFSADAAAGFAFSVDGSRLAAVSGSRNVIMIDTETGETINTFTRDRDITAVALIGDAIVVGYTDGGIALLRADDTAWRDLRNHTAAVTDITPHQDGTQMFTASADGTIILWDVATVEPLRQFQTNTSGVSEIILPENAATFVSSSVDGIVILWQLDDNDTLIAWTRDNRFITPFTPSDCRAFNIPAPCG